MRKIKVSFDFDSTLTTDTVQEFAKTLIDSGLIDVHIVTGRFSKHDSSGNKVNNSDVFEIASELNIPTENIHFCEMEDKLEFFKLNPDFLFHLDDDRIELDFIRQENLNVFPILRSYTNDWLNMCRDLIRINLNK